jgi:hypothetical protein
MGATLDRECGGTAGDPYADDAVGGLREVTLANRDRARTALPSITCDEELAFDFDWCSRATAHR